MKVADRIGLALIAVFLFSISAHAVMVSAPAVRRSLTVGFVDTCSVPLVAAKHTTIGEVHAQVVDGTNVMVVFMVTDGYSSLRTTHLYIGPTPPRTSAPGRFPFKHDRIRTDFDVFTIPLAAAGLKPGDCFYVAAHAEADIPVAFRPPDLESFNDALPDSAIIAVNYPGDDSYLDATITQGGILDGVYDNWCVDTDHEIGVGVEYPSTILSSLSAVSPDVIEFPGNLDLVNFVLNQGYTGNESTSAGTFTWGDVQQALWTLIEDNVPQGGVGTEPFDQRRVDEIVADAYTRGEGFLPGCNQIVSVLVNPTNEQGQTIAQVTILEVPLRCEPVLARETAWGMGSTRFKTGWGSHFRCCP